jgi:hypothetical protein
MIASVLLEELQHLGDPEDYEVWVWLPPDSEHGHPQVVIGRGDRVQRRTGDGGLSAVLTVREDDGDLAIIPEQRVQRIVVREREE